MGPEEWYEMYVRPFHPELALVGMRVLAQVISASSCERNWSPMGTFTRKFATGLRQLRLKSWYIQVYSNRKAAAAASDDELKMFAWDNE
jgi:hypothetical protein